MWTSRGLDGGHDRSGAHLSQERGDDEQDQKDISSVRQPGRQKQHGVRPYALGLGCETRCGDQFVAADGVDLSGPAQQLGVSCRICKRGDCLQRAFPPVDKPFLVTRDERQIVPCTLAAKAPGPARSS